MQVKAEFAQDPAGGRELLIYRMIGDQPKLVHRISSRSLYESLLKRKPKGTKEGWPKGKARGYTGVPNDQRKGLTHGQTATGTSTGPIRTRPQSTSR